VEETQIQITQPARVFRQSGDQKSKALKQSRGEILATSVTVNVRRPVRMNYHHEVQTVVPFGDTGEGTFLLLKDLSKRNVRRLRDIFPDDPLLVKRKT